MRNPSEREAIRELAYRLWQARGHRHGHAQDDWLEAEREILSGGTRAPENEPARENGNGSITVADATSIPRVDLNGGELTEAPKIGSRDAPGG